MITKETGGVGGLRTGGDHPNDIIIENGQNAEKSPGDLRRLAVTQTPNADAKSTNEWIIIIIIIWKTKKILRQNQIIKTKLDIPKDFIKILPASRVRIHEDVPTIEGKQNIFWAKY